MQDQHLQIQTDNDQQHHMQFEEQKNFQDQIEAYSHQNQDRSGSHQQQDPERVEQSQQTSQSQPDWQSLLSKEKTVIQANYRKFAFLISKHQSNHQHFILTNPYAKAVPSNQQLQSLQKGIQQEFPDCSVQQIITLLYNNLIKLPRESQLSDENDFDFQLLFNGGTYLSSLKQQTDLDQFTQRRKIVYVYASKAYGIKVYNDYMAKKYPSQPPMEKDKYKNHLVQIYKTVIKKVEEFLLSPVSSNGCDRVFDPMTKQQFHKSLPVVINCRKYFDREICETFFSLLRAIFDLKVQKIPNEKEVVKFYSKVLTMTRESDVEIRRRAHPFQCESVDSDIWSVQFEAEFVNMFAQQLSIDQVYMRLINNNIEYKYILDTAKLKAKLDSLLRLSIRWIQSYYNGRNDISSAKKFVLNQRDCKFITIAPELTKCRIELLKLYTQRCNDPQLMQSVVQNIRQGLNQHRKGRLEQSRTQLNNSGNNSMNDTQQQLVMQA